MAEQRIELYTFYSRFQCYS